MMLILLYISKSKGGPVGKSLVRAIAFAMALGAWSSATYAAGLGKLNVVSSLGQSFRAEIDLVLVKKEEASSLAVKLASPDAFKQADLPFTAYVSGLKLSVEKRPNGDPYVKVSSYQPLNEPFIDFLVELSWTSGRLVRAYTALVDPPTITDVEAAKPAPEVRAAPPAPEPKAEPAPAKPAAGAIEAAPAERAPAAASASTPPAKSATGAEVKVKRGDTLEKIGQAHKPADVSLEQMLVMLYRDNADAFVGKNMNRLRAGRILRLPDSAELASIAPADAHKEVRIQAADWNAYRDRLAAAVGGAPAGEAGAGRTAAGSVTTKVEDKIPAPPEAPREVLKLSKGEPGKAGAPATDGDRVRSLEEEVAAKDKAVGEANMRVAALEKTVKDMQSLLEMKSKGGTNVVKPAATPAPPAPAKAEMPATPKPETPVAMPAKPAEPVAAAPVPAVPGATQEPLPAPKPQKKFVPPPPPPSLMDEVLDNPALLGGGVVALLGLGGVGYLVSKRRRGGATETPATKAAGRSLFKKKAAEAAAAAAGEDASVPAATAAASAGDISEEGDALAEAEIFLTYGRDNLAEERLKEAIALTPKRYELHAKLLELYAKRKDVAAFDQIAKELQIGTGGRGELWNQAVALGHAVDPENPRYASARPAVLSDDDGATTVVMGAAGLAAAAGVAAAAVPENLDFNLGFDDSDAQMAGTSTDIDLGGLSAEANDTKLTATDFDLGAVDSTLPPSANNASFDPGATLAGLASESTVQMSAPLPGALKAPDSTAGLDFDFDVSGISAPPVAEPVDEGGITFDLSDLDDGSAEPASRYAPDLDLSGINLDLGGAAAPATSGKDERWYDVQTKFDLAKAYQEMGDKEGAREILQEVLAEGDAEQKASARTVLATLN